VTGISDESALRELLGEPAQIVRAKVSGRLSDLTRRFVDLSPFVPLATGAPDGTCDVSPGGDPPCFDRVLDERTLLIPDRPGNRLADSLRNVLRNPHVGLLEIHRSLNPSFDAETYDGERAKRYARREGFY
jgi:predicted pyridoxine 5'-phosphate oxidase superfamily flavin-nucleotide-binding protein